jgi:hypothetical protein
MKLILATMAAALILIEIGPTEAKQSQGASYDVHGFGAAGATTAIAIGKQIARKGAKLVPHRHRHIRAVHRGSGKSLAGVTPVLAAKAREIVAVCGSIVISAVAGRPNRSNHPGGRAVDLQGNPACIYDHLQGWLGGYSTDYATAPGGKHVHVSWNPGGQEWGARFVHRHGKSRYAHRHRRYAHAL